LRGIELGFPVNSGNYILLHVRIGLHGALFILAESDQLARIVQSGLCGNTPMVRLLDIGHHTFPAQVGRLR